jgi:RNA polymerase sigma-70 factor (sigma-E family)
MGTSGGEFTRPTADDVITQLYRQHRLALVRLGVFLVSDRAVAEELVQDAFIGLYQRWGSLYDHTAAHAYIRRSLVNGCRSHQRRSLVARLHRRVGEPEALPPADTDLLLDEEHREVLTLLRDLPQRQREVLVLRYWSELSEAEIASTLGISRGTVKSSASRGLHTLERHLKDTP